MAEFNPLIIIPSYNTGGKLLSATVRAARSSGYPVSVVIDGSTDGSETALAQAAGDDPGIRILRLPVNGGKGNAVLKAAEEAWKNHYTHALVMDADGQHPAAEIGPMLRRAEAAPGGIIMGQPAFGPDAPRARVIGRRLTNFWTELETLGCGLGDTLFGMRVYPLEPFLKAFSQTPFARGFDFDPEIAVRMAWLGCRPVPYPVKVRYLGPEEGGVSHFNYIRDNAKLTFLHIRLVPEFLVVRLFPFLKRKRLWKHAS